MPKKGLTNFEKWMIIRVLKFNGKLNNKRSPCGSELGNGDIPTAVERRAVLTHRGFLLDEREVNHETGYTINRKENAEKR